MTGEASATPVVRSETSGAVATVTLDAPANRNALSAELCAQLLGALRSALDDGQVRVIVLTHSGSVFCSGADLKETSEERKASAGRDFTAALELIWTSPKPVVAHLSGTVRAGGIGLVATADFAVAADTVSFAFTEVRIGVVPAVISVPLRHRVSPHALYRLFLSGDTFDARYAAEIGLLSGVAPAAELEDHLHRLVESLILAGPQAWAATKRLLRSDAPSIAADLAAMQDLSADYFRSAEAAEGIRAYAERRRPAWASPPAKMAP